MAGPEQGLMTTTPGVAQPGASEFDRLASRIAALHDQLNVSISQLEDRLNKCLLPTPPRDDGLTDGDVEPTASPLVLTMKTWATTLESAVNRLNELATRVEL